MPIYSLVATESTHRINRHKERKAPYLFRVMVLLVWLMLLLLLVMMHARMLLLLMHAHWRWSAATAIPSLL